MNKKHATGLIGLCLGSVLLAWPGTALGAEVPRLQSMAGHNDTRIHIAQAAAAPAEKPVSYASDQADRGETQFGKLCVDCHGDDLRGGLLGGPPLRGLAFETKFATESPAGVLFDVMSTTMPPNAPGGLSASTYADLMAYILKRNGFAAGAPLPTDGDTLYTLIIDK